MARMEKVIAILLTAVMVISGMTVSAGAESAGAGDGAEVQAAELKVTSVLPEEHAVDVPVNTGIEITFSERNYSDIDSLFSISPEVKGTFQRHGKTVVFVPDEELAYATVYTVTLKAGVKSTATGAVTGSDTVFSFETRSRENAKDADDIKNPSWTMYLYNEYAELPTSEEPRIGMSYYYDTESEKPDPDVAVYKFKDTASAVDYLSENGSRLWWTCWNNTKKQADVSSMEKVGEFKLAESYNSKIHVMSLPFKLDDGFYAINISCEGITRQMILQMNDLPAQMISGGDQSIFWVNKAGTGDAVKGAEISLYGGKSLGTTGKDGVLSIKGGIDSEAFYQVKADGHVNIIAPEYTKNAYYYSADIGSDKAAEGYWSELQLDRSIFQKDDSVYYWGYASPRAAAAGGRGASEVGKVTVAVSEAWDSQNVLCRETVDVKDGSFSGSVKLPSLDAGSYCISVYKGSSLANDPVRLSSEYFTVQKYEKPSYKIELSSDKKAAFAGDTVNFTARTSFYEGTPASKLEIGYNASYAFESMTGTVTSDADGKAVVAAKLKDNTYEQGSSWEYFGVHAQLPEKGKISAESELTVFNNDINVDISGERNGKNATLKFKVNDITLDKINNSNDEYWQSGDELGAATAGKQLDVTIYRVYWEKYKTGTSYDYITKKSYPVYEYERHEEPIDEFSVTTGSSGKAEKSFTVPDKEKESYYAMISCTDGNGKTMTFERYLGESYDDYFYSMYSGSYYHLDGAKESYKEGDKIDLQLKYGEEAVKAGSCLFVELQNGIISYKAGSSSYTGKFTANDAPNKYIRAYYFNGYKYMSGYDMQSSLRYDREQRKLDIQVETDKDTYKPGDSCTVTIKTKAGGKAKKAHVNLAAVDEAVFDVEEYSVDTLASLYSNVSDGLTESFATHDAYIAQKSDENSIEPAESADVSDSLEKNYIAGGSGMLESQLSSGATADSADRGGSDSAVREEFKDTAAFASIDTDENGSASYTFKVPDDITSWRLTVSAVTDDLYAGNATRNISATAPVIVNYTLADTYMTGDTPAAGVTTYGRSITDGSTVKYEVWDTASPDKKYTASGKAFSRVDIPLWQMNEEGSHSLMIKATAADGSSDTVKHEYDVISTSRTAVKAETSEAKAGMSFDADSAGGINTIIFADAGRGKYLGELVNLTYGSVMRLETALAGSEAASLMEKYFPDYAKQYMPENDIELKKYQKSDGGMAILPYAGSNIKTTAQLMPLLAESSTVDKEALKGYLESAAEGSSGLERAQALYGMAVLGEGDIAQLDNEAAAAGAVTDAESAEQLIYIASAYAYTGAADKAARIYNEKLVPLMENTDPYCRLRAGADADGMLDATGACMLLAQKLDMPEAENMFNYCARNYSSEIVKAAYEAIYIKNAIADAASDGSSITYSLYGEKYTKELSSQGMYGSAVLRVAASQLNQLSVDSVAGSVCAIRIKNSAAKELKSYNNDITVKRRYYKKGSDKASNTFAQGDIVKVNVWVDYSENAIGGSYTITDYLPAGLAYVDDSAVTGGRSYDDDAMWYSTNDGQKVIFNDYWILAGKGRLYSYYARVVSPGSFTAEGTVVQSGEASDAVYVCAADKVQIK